MAYYFHAHHDFLIDEYTVAGARGRRQALGSKSPEEVSLRLRLFQPVKGKLSGPPSLAMVGALHYDKLLDKLHRKQCRNCPWNGKTIFTRWSVEKQEWV